MPRKKKHSPEETPKKRPALMAYNHFTGEWYWHNVEGVFVNLVYINNHGIVNILHRLEDEGPKHYLEVIEREAQRRGLLDADGRIIKGAADPAGEAGT